MEVVLVQSDATEHRGDPLGMLSHSTVRSANESDLLGPEAVGVRHSVLEDRNRLKGLHRRAPIRQDLRIPGTQFLPSRRAAHNSLHMMCGFHGAAAPHVYNEIDWFQGSVSCQQQSAVVTVSGRSCSIQATM